MTDDRSKDTKPRDIDAQRKSRTAASDESFAGADIAGDEEEQTRDRERAGHDHTDEVGEITETELDDWDSI